MIPSGTTHVYPTDPLGHTLNPIFMRWTFWFIGESGYHHYRWFNWSRGSWHVDNSFSNRLNRLVTVKEFLDEQRASDSGSEETEQLQSENLQTRRRMRLV